MSGFKDAKVSNRAREPRLSEIIDVLEIEPDTWYRLRFLGPLWSYVRFWIKTKDQNGAPRKAFPKICLDYDAASESFSSESCPYRKGLGQDGQRVYIANAIVRDIQENEPRKRPEHTKSERKKRDLAGYSCYVKEGKSKSWTPIRAVELPSSIVEKLQNLSTLNKVKNKKTGNTEFYDIMDPRYGIDVNIRKNSKGTGTGIYEVMKEERTPLTEEELDLLMQDITVVKPESIQKARKEWESISKRLYVENEQNQDDDDYLSKKKKKTKASKRAKNEDQDQDDDLNDLDDINTDDLDDLNDNEDEAPKKKAKKTASKRSRDEDQNENQDQDEDDAPKRKKKAKSKRSRDQDQDQDDDINDLNDLEDQNEEDEPPRKKKRR